MTNHGAVGLRSVVSRNDRLSAQALDEELIMTNLETGEYYGLDSSGRRIWDLLATPTSVDQLCSVLMKEYSVGRSQCEEDVIAFVSELQREGLISIG